ncbi:MAG: cob(I)yrinic acid a,c-diamide adenosyltransferase [Candidatus Methanomethylicia archaeon]
MQSIKKPCRIGLIEVYTGEGRGKTTAAFGLALRAVGHGMNVCIIQFMKYGDYGEIKAVERLKPNLKVVQFGNGFINKYNIKNEDLINARKAIDYARKAILEGSYDIVILDEVNIALSLKLIDLNEVINILKNKPSHVEIILTGRYAPKEIIEIADLVTEFKEVKHPFKNKNLNARPGIEY